MTASTRLFLLPFLMACFAAIAHSAKAACSDARPNILFIYTDDQSHRTVGCYDESPEWVQTPNLHRLARDGLRFRRAYAGPWCVPSRLSLLSGRQLHGVVGVPNEFPYWPESLRKAGYHTAMIGKWHQHYHPPQDGLGTLWDHTVMWKRTGPYYVNQKLSVDGGPPEDVQGYSTDNYTRFALNYIKREHDRPWFLWLCYDAAHSPYIAPARHADRYRGVPVQIPADIYPPRPNKPAYLRDMAWYWKPGTEKHAGVPVRTYQDHGANYDKWKGIHPDSLPEIVRMYHRAVLAVDEGVGRIVDALKQTGQLDNTLIVFTSDQGYAFGQHGLEDKVAPYDACMRVPLLVRAPGRVARGKVCEHPVNQLDLVATFLTLAGAMPPVELHGHDLGPILLNPQSDWPHPVLSEHFAERFGDATNHARTADDYLHGVPWWLFLTQGRYKYIRYLLEDEIEELYDLESDPEELNNLAVDRKHHDLVADYRRRLEKELRRTDARLVDNLPKPKIVSQP